MTVEGSLLAEIALHLARSPEDVATEGLAYVLTRSDAARSTMVRLAEDWSLAEGRKVSSVRSQAGSDDGSRPDIELLDASGRPVILLENKFWAGLTDAQPNSYLERLDAAGGVLWFVAPVARLPFLWPELLNWSRSETPAATVQLDYPEVKVARIDANRLLVLTSWPYLAWSDTVGP